MTEARWPTAALAALDAWSAKADPDRYNEAALRDYLGAALAGRGGEAPTVATEVTAGLRDWPGVGKFDIAIGDPSAPSLLCAFETKWAKRPANINEALWDAAKLGLGVAGGRTAEAYLLYGSPSGAFNGGGVGPQLFAGDTFDLAQTIYRHRAWWDWPVKTRPIRLPVRIVTAPAGQVAWRSRGGKDWQVRCLSVSAGSATWTEYVDGWPVPTPSV